VKGGELIMAAPFELRLPGNGGGNYCTGCGGHLYRTKDAGEPVEEDHEPGCEVFSRAVQVMLYVEQLKRAATAGADRRRRRYLQKSAKDLTTAACTDDVVLAITKLAHRYEKESQQGAKTGATAEMLMQACQALAQGQDPAPIAPGPSH
jgi:hypothetical protein